MGDACRGCLCRCAYLQRAWYIGYARSTHFNCVVTVMSAATMSRSRVKRASAEDLYRQCQLGADCPPDVKNKFENNTVADRILKWVAGFLYLGTLGIGTGRGTGGRGGYVPIGRGPGTTTEIGGTRTLRPVGPVEPIGPGTPTVIDATPPVDVVETPIDPTLTDVRPTDPSVFEPGGEDIELEVLRPDETLQPEEDVLAGSNPTTDLPTVGEPNIDFTETSFTEVRPPVSRTADISETNLDNAAYNAAVAEFAREANQVSVIFDAEVGGSVVGSEEFELEEVPLTSTPENPARPAGRRRNWGSMYHRFIKQVRLASTSFSRADVGGRFEFENPAFEGDVGVSEEMMQTRDLGEVFIAKGPEGRVRMSRLARIPGMHTRSGLELGEHVHLFADMSTIEELPLEETIELSTFSNPQGVLDSGPVIIESEIGATQGVVVNEQTPNPFDNADLGNTVSETADLLEWGVEDIELLAQEDYNFTGGRLRLLDVEEAPDIDDWTLESPRKAYAVATINKDSKSQVPVKIPVHVDPSDVVVISYTADVSIFSLFEPSLYRKRKYSYLY